MKMAIFKSVTKATFASLMLFISIVRLGMLAYPQNPARAVAPEAVPLPNPQSRVVNPEAGRHIMRHIIMGQHTIRNLQKTN